MYDSKRAIRQTYRAGGVEEVGNDPDYTDPAAPRFIALEDATDSSVSIAFDGEVLEFFQNDQT